MKIHLVDDHKILMDGIKTLLDNSVGLSVTGSSETAEAAIEILSKSPVDLVITDMSLPGMDGLSFIRKAKQIMPETKFIMLSMHDENHLVREVLKEGVAGYVLKKDSHRELLAAIEAVQQDEVYISNDLNKILISNFSDDAVEKLLTTREREILSLIIKEFSNKEIAARLHISTRTVETHRKNLFRKTKSSTVVGLINFAYANKLV
ncbi:MAG: DNA-binding response regulator [Calditrichaeota bacterium]|nr:MAG: DNA-binding response regulator [Calditrichota bacterium]